MSEPVADDSIGTAHMTAEGALVLELHAEEAEGPAGHGRLVYPRSHPAYRQVLLHLGGLKPGEFKPVPPWPED